MAWTHTARANVGDGTCVADGVEKSRETHPCNEREVRGGGVGRTNLIVHPQGKRAFGALLANPAADVHAGLETPVDASGIPSPAMRLVHLHHPRPALPAGGSHALAHDGPVRALPRTLDRLRINLSLKPSTK